MPMYEYKCASCDSVFKVKHSMNSSQDTCVKCNSEDIEKLISSFNTVHSLDQKSTTNLPAGTVVNKHIEEARAEIKKEKDKLRSREL